MLTIRRCYKVFFKLKFSLGIFSVIVTFILTVSSLNSSFNSIQVEFNLVKVYIYYYIDFYKIQLISLRSLGYTLFEQRNFIFKLLETLYICRHSCVVLVLRLVPAVRSLEGPGKRQGKRGVWIRVCQPKESDVKSNVKDPVNMCIGTSYIERHGPKKASRILKP